MTFSEKEADVITKACNKHYEELLLEYQSVYKHCGANHKRTVKLNGEVTELKKLTESILTKLI